MNILVTGSSGTIGTRLCEKLLTDGHTVVGLDWLPNEWQASVNDITQIVDMRDEAAVKAFGESLPEKPDVIVHLAANARVYELVENPDMARDNMLTIYNALELARQLGCQKFIFASSRETYGNNRATTCTEDMVRVENCESAYSASKVAGEALVHAYRECYGVDSVIFRFSNVYGMYDNSNRFVPLFVRALRKNEPVTVFGEQKVLDFTYIDDTIDGITLAIEKFDQAKGHSFNLGNGEGTNLVDATNTIKELLGSTSEVSITESRVGEVMHYIADISQARDILGFDPKVPFAEGIERSVEWYNAYDAS